MADDLAQYQIETIIVPFRAWVGKNKNPLAIAYRSAFNAVSMARLTRRLRSIPLDMIYTNSLYSPIGARVAHHFTLPHIWHIHELIHEDFNYSFDFGIARSLRFVQRSSEMVIVNSTFVRDKWRQYIPENKLKLVYYGFPEIGDEPGISPRAGFLKAEEVVLCLVGRLAPHKGQHEAMRALVQLVACNINARLRLAGSGDASHVVSLKQLAVDLGVAERIAWEGFVDDVFSVYATSDIALMCSRSEAFGRVVVEAMAMGCPVIGTRAGGVPDIITHGENGFLYQSGDYDEQRNSFNNWPRSGADSQFSRNAITTAPVHLRQYCDSVRDYRSYCLG
jgi:glycosyltransferase involved in cell wall biosynthesis